MIKFYILLFISIIYSEEKSSLDIQREIDSRFSQVELLKEEIKTLEENIISKTKNEINISELLLDIDYKIKLTEKLIKSINREEKSIQKQIDKSYLQIEKQEKKLKDMQDRLKHNMIHAYKNGKPTFLESILNVNNLYDVTYKTKYLKKINTYQQRNKEILKELISDLKSENRRLKKKMQNKKKIIKSKLQEAEHLKKDIKTKNELLKEITTEKESDKKRLNRKQKNLEEIESIIKKLYSNKESQEKREKELAEIRKLQQMAVNGNFKSMKGKLPWPIKGTIISKFGNKKNQKLKTITENIGIDIKASKSTKVKAVLDGVVSTITYIRGHGNIIILDHGDGFNTVYSSIDNIIINENDYIKAGQNIASVNENMILHFEIWGNQKKMDPEIWLIKK